MNEERYTQYISLGDSISIDLYPALDAGGEAFGEDCRGLGAASLFFRNRNDRWPEFAGRDLETVHGLKAADWLDCTADGATTRHVLTSQLRDVVFSTEPTLVSLTIGGNDIVGLLSEDAAKVERLGLVGGIAGRIREIVRQVKELRPDSVVLLGTVYDPSDGTDWLALGGSVIHRPDAGVWLRQLNDAIRVIAEEEPVVLADIHRHFLGHGWESDDSWYWPPMVIEPSARGASEVRRVWWNALTGEAR